MNAPAFEFLKSFRRVFLTLVFTAAVAAAGTPGTFRGFLIEGAHTKHGWMYVQSRNDMLRLVRIRGAVVSYDDKVPVNQRLPHPADSLRPGAEVRVTAVDDGRGNWRAREIEILAPPPTREAQIR